MKKKNLDRREFLRMAALGGTGLALAACGAQPTPETVVETVVETVEVVKEVEVIKEVAAASDEKIVNFLTESWNWEKLNMANATDHYNQMMRTEGTGIRVEVDPAPDGWEAKVIQMVKDEELLWNGHLRTVNIGNLAQTQGLGILQPWDEYINASSAAWAGSFWDELLPGVRESFTIDGKLWALPWDGEVFTRVYNKPLWDAIGEAPAETLDEFEKQLAELKVAHPDKTPMGLRHHTELSDQHMFMQMWDQTGEDIWLNEADGSYLNVQSDAYKEYLSMIKRWYDGGLITDENWGKTVWEQWNSGDVCCGQSGVSWLTSKAQAVWGQSNIIEVPNVVLNKGDAPKTLTFANGAMLFKGAEMPQESTDWLMWMLDPTVEKVANYSFIRGTLNYKHIPVYQSIYDNIVPTDSNWAWMSVVKPMIDASIAMPPDSFASVIIPIVNSWEEKYAHGDVGMDEAINEMEAEFRDAVAKAS